MQAFLFVTALAGASAALELNKASFATEVKQSGKNAALELNKASFDTEVKQSGKNAFVKFLAPW